MVSVLAIGAHPDDIELGCSATLLKHRKFGDEIHLLVLSRGEASGDPEIRERECRSAAKLMDAEKIIFGGLEDTKIHDSVETIMVIEKMINEINPDVIYTHSYKDTHQDHRNVAYATLSAGRRSKKILMYESPTTYGDFQPKLFVDIQDEFEKKIEIMRSYFSQSEKHWFSGESRRERAPRAVEGLAFYRGFQAGVEVAEAFEVGKLVLMAEEQLFTNAHE